MCPTGSERHSNRAAAAASSVLRRRDRGYALTQTNRHRVTPQKGESSTW